MTFPTLLLVCGLTGCWDFLPVLGVGVPARWGGPAALPEPDFGTSFEVGQFPVVLRMYDNSRGDPLLAAYLPIDIGALLSTGFAERLTPHFLFSWALEVGLWSWQDSPDTPGVLVGTRLGLGYGTAGKAVFLQYSWQTCFDAFGEEETRIGGLWLSFYFF